MDLIMVRRLLADKLTDAETYWIALVVGTLINAYGQLLVPWIRGTPDPFMAMALEFRTHPWLTTFSVLLAYAFPLAVGMTSAVITRYKSRRIESVADFPERKPDPVFRADHNGRVVEAGATTLRFLRDYQIDTAQKLLGAPLWSEISAARAPGGGQVIFFGAENTHYAVSYAPTADNRVNVYMTRLAGKNGSGRNTAAAIPAGSNAYR